jgi:hypothetical protein
MEKSPSWEADQSMQLTKKFPAFYGTRRFFTILKIRLLAFLNQGCERPSLGFDFHLTAGVAECIWWIYTLSWHIKVEQTLCTSETITHWALASNWQRTVSHICMTCDCLLQHVQTTSYRPPVTHICRLFLSHSLMQRERCGWRRNSGNIF